MLILSYELLKRFQTGFSKPSLCALHVQTTCNWDILENTYDRMFNWCHPILSNPISPNKIDTSHFVYNVFKWFILLFSLWRERERWYIAHIPHEPSCKRLHLGQSEKATCASVCAFFDNFNFILNSQFFDMFNMSWKEDFFFQLPNYQLYVPINWSSQCVGVASHLTAAHPT